MRKPARWGLLWTSAVAIVSVDPCAAAPAERPSHATGIKITVSDRVLHEIDPRLFGQFMERPSWGEIGPEAAVIPGTHELRPEARQLLRQMRVPLARFPGGTDVDYIDWLDMIDNVPGRPGARPVTTGHQGDRVTNNFGYDEFLRLCEELKMEPILVVNFRQGLLDYHGPEKAAAHAAKLVAYCNAPVQNDLPNELDVWPALRAKNGHPAAYKVKWFQIGNETWAFSGKTSQDRYIAALEAYVGAMRAVDPTVRIIVDGQPADLAAAVHRRLGDQIAYFAVHHYQPWQIRDIQRAGKPVDVKDLSARDIWYAWVTVPAVDADGQSVLMRDELNQAREMGYRVAMTEWNWNGWWARSIAERTEPASLYTKGVGAAGILHAIMRQGDVVRLAAQSMLIGDRWGIHAICCDRHGRTPPYMVPSGQVTMLYSWHHGDKRLKVDLAGVPRYEQPYRMAGNAPAHGVAFLDVMATRSDKTLYIHAINRHFDHALSVEIDVYALTRQPGRRGTLHTLEGRLRDAPEPGESPAPGRIRDEPFDIAGSQFSIRLPARSVSVIEVPLALGKPASGESNPAGKPGPSVR
jgi:alpha-L-arabinofuranosidase